MILAATPIRQPLSGEYTERIYDIDSVWKTDEWSWLLFESESDSWCGEFRGAFRGVAVSEKLRLVVVLTEDCMYLLDIETAAVIDSLLQPQYVDITVTPDGNILVADWYGIELFRGRSVAAIECITVPVHPDYLRFREYDGNRLRITCYECGIWDEELELYLDCDSFEWIDA